jgi:hypothetical protein
MASISFLILVSPCRHTSAINELLQRLDEHTPEVYISEMPFVLDLLSTFENGHKLEWLPSRIAVNVKIVLSVNSDNEDCLTRMRHKCPDSLVDIPPIRVP